MKLYIAEKPSLGRALAQGFAFSQKKHDGYIELNSGDCITWCIGHLLEQAEPQEYDPAYKQWKSQHLPIIPKQWQLKAKPNTKKQLAVVKKLIAKASLLIHVGDPDREGQLLVDEVVNHLKTPKHKVAAMQRCLVSDLTPSAVKRALNQLKPNSEYISLSVSALARSRADWLYGINMTRAYTLQGQKAGYSGVLSVGRVQTPVLGLVVQREQAIAAFVAKPFFDVLAHLETKDTESFTAKWQPSEACLPYQDDEGRILNKALAENVRSRIHNKLATVLKSITKDKQQLPPLLFNLSQLQIEAAKQYAMTAKQVLDHCQSLYERHQLITYPRSDCRYLPEQHFKQCRDVINAISHHSPELSRCCQESDQTRKSRAFNDKKVGAHHAIIPTAKPGNNSRLTQEEKLLYRLIALQYLAQFYPPFKYVESIAEIEIEGGMFITKTKRVTAPGFKVLFDAMQQNDAKTAAKEATYFPALKKGQRLTCLYGEIVEKVTQPPKSFTDATLLAAMTGISRYVHCAQLRTILKETDGLGTEATRAGIIELLFKRGFLQRSGKKIIATQAGIGLIHSLPLEATQPDMTARWESQLADISAKTMTYHQFMTPLEAILHQFIQQALSQIPEGLKGLKPVTQKRATTSNRKWNRSKNNRRKSSRIKNTKLS